MGAPLNLAPGNAQVFEDVGLWARPESFPHLARNPLQDAMQRKAGRLRLREAAMPGIPWQLTDCRPVSARHPGTATRQYSREMFREWRVSIARSHLLQCTTAPAAIIVIVAM